MSNTMAPGAGANGQPQTQAQMQQRAMLKSFRKNTRRRFQQFNFTFPTLAPNGSYSAIAPQVGLASRIFIHVRLAVSDSAASPSCTKLARGPFGYITRLQLVTNLGSNNIWDADGFHTFLNNISKPFTLARYDQNFQNGYDSAVATSDYANDPWFQYVAPTVQNTVYNQTFTLRIDLAVNSGMNFTQGLLNLQAPQVQASINITTGGSAQLFTTGDTLTITGSANVTYEYFEIPNPLRKVALPAGMLHCTLEQNVPFAATGVQSYTIPRQGLLLRLIQETVLNGVLAKGGPVGSAGNPGTAGIDNYSLQLNNQDTIYFKPYELQQQLQAEEFAFFSKFTGVALHEFFGAMDMPGRGDMRDVIDTEAVTTTQFNTQINSAATLGSNNNYFNFTREILLPFNTQATGA